MRASMTLICSVALLTACLITGRSCYGQAAEASGVSAAEAKQIAAAFAEKLGMALGEDATVALTEPGSRFRSPAEWEIKYYDFSLIDVDPATGRVTAFVDYVARRNFIATPTTDPIAEEQAVRAATGVLEAMGRPEGCVLHGTLYQREGENSWEWTVQWDRRTPEGIRFDSNTAVVWLDAQTGRPNGGATVWSTPMPLLMDVKVSKDEAVRTALALAQARGAPSDGAEATAETGIVQPNYYWSGSPMFSIRYDTPSRLAWVVTLTVGGERGYFMKFDVDAADGSIIGGTRSGDCPIAPPRGTRAKAAIPGGDSTPGKVSALVLVILALTLW